MQGYSPIVRRRFYTRYLHGRIFANSAMRRAAASRDGCLSGPVFGPIFECGGRPGGATQAGRFPIIL
jgi:hypothetical protein